LNWPPDSIDGYSNLGAVYVEQGKYGEAIDALERSIKIQPTASALNNVGTVYFTSDDTRKRPAVTSWPRS